MRRGYLLLVCAGCGFHGPGDSPDAVLPDGGASVNHAFVLKDFTDGQLANMTAEVWRGDVVHPTPALTPTAYTYGGLVAHGLQGMSLWAPGNTSWSNLTRPATGAGLWAGEEIKNGVRTDYLGVFGDSTMTLWLEGEVWLDASPNQAFKVNGDAVGFVELAPPGTTAFAKIAEDATVPVPTTSAGWYPVRIGFSNNDGTFDFTFTHSDDGRAQVAWTRERLRARTSELNGALRTVFGRQILGGGQNGAPPVLHFDQIDLLHTTSLSPPPQGAGNDDWSARYLGQIYVVQGGDYTLQITSDDGNRGRFGATSDQLHWFRDEGVGAPPLSTKQYPATLAAGWNDLTVDYNQVGGMRSLRVQIQGPDFPGVVDVPRDRLRPVELADDRLAFGGDETNRLVTDGGGAGNPATDTIAMAGHIGESVSSIELTYQASSPLWNELKIDLETPSGTRVNLPDPGALSAGDHMVQVTIAGGAQATLLGGSPNGNWKLHMYDVNIGGGTSTLESAQLTLHTQGGPDKVARSATWTSAVLDATTSLIAIDGITWIERAPAGASVAVRFRAC